MSPLFKMTSLADLKAEVEGTRLPPPLAEPEHDGDAWVRGVCRWYQWTRGSICLDVTLLDDKVQEAEDMHFAMAHINSLGYSRGERVEGANVVTDACDRYFYEQNSVVLSLVGDK